MKNIKKYFLAIMLISLVISCNNGEVSLAGEWSSKNNTLIITKEDKLYYIKIGEKSLVGRFEDDLIKTGSNLGDIKYSEEKDKIYFNDEEYTRKEVLEAEAKKEKMLKECFHGLWSIKRQEGGNMIIDTLEIELLENGRFRFKDRNIYNNTEFKQLEYKEGHFKGSFITNIDSESKYDFEITLVDTNTINYIQPAEGEVPQSEQNYIRVVELDDYTGNWRGIDVTKTQKITLSISKVLKKYTIKEMNKSEITSINTGTLKDRKIVYSGDPNTFYKYYSPTIELLPNGHLHLSSGIGDYDLTKNIR